MRRVLLTLSALGLSATLVGCSAFYPNWGATGLPEEPESSFSQEPTETLEETETSESSEPEATESEEPEASAEPEVVRKQVQVEIIMAVAEPDFGVLTVVAQIPGMAEAGGNCIMRFIGSDKEVSMEVRAEPSSDYTQCFPIEFPLADLPAGNGIVTVSYESPTHFGLSPASSVVIP
jgi:hypothetical protein